MARNLAGRRPARLGAAILLVALAGAGKASAGEYAVHSCAGDSHYSSRAFAEFSSRGMVVKRACNPQGRGLRGLLTGNRVRRGAVSRGARAAVVLRAPYGTRFRTLRWSGTSKRTDCRYSLAVYADGPGMAPRRIRQVPANSGCGGRGDVRSAGWPRPRRYPIQGANRVVQEIVCRGPRGRRSCSAARLNYIRTLNASVTITDDLQPTVAIAGLGLASGRWLGGTQALRFSAWDNVGVRVARAFVGGHLVREGVRCKNPIGGGTKATSVASAPPSFGGRLCLCRRCTSLRVGCWN